MTPPKPASAVTLGSVERGIIQVRGDRVMLDETLARLYDVEVRALNQAVKRNIDRFPGDFMFQLTPDEAALLKSQTVTSSPGHGGRRKLHYAFTEQGVAMLSSVLHSPRAIRVNIEIMRAFVRLRQMLRENVELAGKLAALERRYDQQFKIVFDAIRELMSPPSRHRRAIGFDKGDP